MTREYSNKEYVKARNWLKEHGCWDHVKDEDGFSVVYYYWYCLAQVEETD